MFCTSQNYKNLSGTFCAIPGKTDVFCFGELTFSGNHAKTSHGLTERVWDFSLQKGREHFGSKVYCGGLGISGYVLLYYFYEAFEIRGLHPGRQPHGPDPDSRSGGGPFGHRGQF
jgi:hypothetical protein